jgi:hypothetical protein
MFLKTAIPKQLSHNHLNEAMEVMCFNYEKFESEMWNDCILLRIMKLNG